MHIEVQDLNELQHFSIQLLKVDTEVPRGDVHAVWVSIILLPRVGVFHREKLLEYVFSVCEICVVWFKSKLDVKVVVLIEWKTESISFKHLSIRHAAIAQEHLWAFREAVTVCPDYKIVNFRHGCQCLLPYTLCIFFAHFYLLVYWREFPVLSQFVLLT